MKQRKPQTKEERERWEQVNAWACRQIGIERIASERSYSGAFVNGARIGDTVPVSGMWYRIPTKGHYMELGIKRCYVWYRGETLEQVKETFAFLIMVYDKLSFVLLH
jgi:hypothetical protein